MRKSAVGLKPFRTIRARAIGNSTPMSPKALETSQRKRLPLLREDQPEPLIDMLLNALLQTHVVPEELPCLRREDRAPAVPTACLSLHQHDPEPLLHRPDVAP